MNKLIDIHTHMLYGIDDGAEDMEMTLRLIKADYDQGVRGIFLTNHSYGMRSGHEDYHRYFEKIKKVVEGSYTDLTLYKGCEILCQKDDMYEIIEKIKVGKYPTMNGTQYVLMEFSPGQTAGYEEMSYCLRYTLDSGYIPIIAHIERYKKIYTEPVSNIAGLKELGCMTQINLYSVAQDGGTTQGEARRELANLFLANHLVDFVGTDAHNEDYKAPEASVGAVAIRDMYGDAYADSVLFEMAEELLESKRIY